MREVRHRCGFEQAKDSIIIGGKFMVIQTRFERNQKVWFRRGSQVCDGYIYSIEITVRPEGVSIRYAIQYSESDGVYLDESKVFATREEAETHGNR